MDSGRARSSQHEKKEKIWQTNDQHCPNWDFSACPLTSGRTLWFLKARMVKPTIEGRRGGSLSVHFIVVPLRPFLPFHLSLVEKNSPLSHSLLFSSTFHALLSVFLPCLSFSIDPHVSLLSVSLLSPFSPFSLPPFSLPSLTLAEMAQQRSYAKNLPGVDRSKAARLYIDGYYKNLIDQTEKRNARFAFFFSLLSPSLSLARSLLLDLSLLPSLPPFLLSLSFFLPLSSVPYPSQARRIGKGDRRNVEKREESEGAGICSG